MLRNLLRMLILKMVERRFMKLQSDSNDENCWSWRSTPRKSYGSRKHFGLDIQVSFVDETGTQRTYSFQAKEKKAYKELSDEEKQKVKSILYLLDKFCIGDAAYHELTMLCEGLPRSYLIKQCKGEINKLSHIARTPGTAQGACEYLYEFFI